MATLEKIRSKSVLLLIIIGGALLAFVIGDFFTSGRTLFGNPTTVAKVDGQSIDIQDFQNRVQLLSQQYQQSGQKIDGATIQQQVLNQMVQEALLKKEYEAAGITVTTEELSDALVGSGSQYVDMFVQQQYGLESAAQLLDIASNPSKYGLDAETARQFNSVWKSLEDNMEQSLYQQKFNNLFVGALQPNNIDAQLLYAESSNNKQVAFVQKSYASLPDDDYPVSDADINAQWAKQKENFRLTEPMKAISYIAVPIVPSVEDLTAAEQKVENALMALRNEPAIDGIITMTDFIVDRQSQPVSRITNTAVKNFIEAGEDTVSAVSHIGNNYTLVKVMGRGMATDDVKIDVAVVPGTTQQADSIIDGLNAGTIDFASVKTLAGEQANEGLDIHLTEAQYAELREPLTDAVVGKWFTPDTAAAAPMHRIFRVVEREAPVPTVDYAVVTFTAEPSRATINSLESQLRDYIAANNNATAFAENAIAAGYSAVPSLVSASTPRIGNYEDTREAVVWALEAKDGKVSPTFGDETSGQFIAVAVDASYDDFIPASASQVEPQLRAQALAAKKGAKLMEENAGKASDIQGYAQLFGADIDTTTVSFTQTIIPRIGNDGKVAGAVAMAQPGTLVGPVEGNNAIVVLQVLNVEPLGRPFDLKESSTNFMRQRAGSALSNMIPQIVMGNKKVENHLSNFYKD